MVSENPGWEDLHMARDTLVSGWKLLVRVALGNRKKGRDGRVGLAHGKGLMWSPSGNCWLGLCLAMGKGGMRLLVGVALGMRTEG